MCEHVLLELLDFHRRRCRGARGGRGRTRRTTERRCREDDAIGAPRALQRHATNCDFRTPRIDDEPIRKAGWSTEHRANTAFRSRRSAIERSAAVALEKTRE